MRFSPLTVLHISTEPGWQGGEQQAYYLATGLRQQGHRSVIVARKDGAFAARMREQYFDVHTFRRRGRGPDALWSLRRLVTTLRPDILHAHDGHGLTAAGLATIGLIRRPLCIASRRVVFPIRSPAKFCHLADGVIGISTAVMDVCRLAGIPETKLRMVHSGVDPERMRDGNRARGRRALNLSENEILLLTVASLTACKGHTHLLDGLPRIFEQFPKARLALVGQGELKHALYDRVADLGITDRVKFLGYRTDIPDLLSAADLFIMPSIEEGLCTSLLDAMVTGVPVVTTAAGGIKDAVGAYCKDGPYGYMVAPRDSEQLCDAIIEALTHPDRSSLLAARAREYVFSKFTHRQMIEGTLSAYHEWLTNSPRYAARSA